MFSKQNCFRFPCFEPFSIFNFYSRQSQQPSNSDAEFWMHRQLKNLEAKLKDMERGNQEGLFELNRF
jgi:hypothetical protein